LACATTDLAGTTVNSVSETPPAGVLTSNYGVWYKFTGDGQQTTISSTAVFDHAMTILTGSACGSFAEILTVDNDLANYPESYTFSTTNGQQYYVWIAHYSTISTTTGTFTISRTCTTPVANDLCADATTLTVGGTVSNHSFVGATSSGGSYADGTYPDVWFKFTATCTGTLQVALTNSSSDADIYLYSNCSSTTNLLTGGATAANNETATASLTSGTVYYLRVVDFDQMASTFSLAVAVPAATTSNAGADQTGASTCGLTSVTLAGNTPTFGTGTWTIISGTGGTITTPSSPTSAFSGLAGSSYTLRWTITNCTSTSTDDVVIIFNQNPTSANAGPNQTNALTCGLTSVTLAGNTAIAGTGAWSIISGTGGTITTPSSPTSTFSGTAGSTYTLRWTISNSPCTASTDDVVITFNRNPTAAAAGADQTSSATCGLTSVTLAGNSPSVGTGAWSIISGAGGNVTTPSSNTSTFTGTAGSTYTLRWTVSNSPCTATTDDVVITFNQNPTAANAGPDQTGAATCGLTSVTLAGNTATVGTGAWSIVSGTGGSVTTASSATSTFTGTAGSTYTLRWTVSNSPCTASTDDVVITFNQNPSFPTSVSPAATTICHGNSVNLNATSAGNTINWYTVASDGIAIQTGVSSAADHSVSPTVNTTYYAEAQNGSGCKSSRTATGLVMVENPVSAVNTAIGTSLQTNDYVWVGQTDAVWSTVTNWRQFDETNLVAAGSAPGSNNTNRIYVVQNATSSNCIFNASSLSLGGELGVTSLLVGTGTSLNLNSQNLNLTGNITINGTFIPGSGTITISGSSNQTIDGSSALSFSNVTINKTGGTLTAAKDMTITGALTLTNGILDMNSKTLTIGTSSANGTITGGSTSSYIVALDGGTPSKLIHRVNSTTNETYRFPIGTGSKYTPVTIVMNSGSTSNASIQVWTKNSKVTGMSNDMSCYLNRSWFVEPTGITSPTYDIQLGFASGDFTGDPGFDLNPVKLSSSIWYKPSGSLIPNGTTQGTTIATSYALPSTPATSSGTVYWNGLTSFSEFGGAGGSAPLPVELVSFAGSCEDGVVNLSWQTASEHNSSHFDLEKSRDGESWQVIETIPSAGNSNELLNYTAYDQVTNILNYYRLNQVDIDGTNKRYDPIAVSCEASQNGIFMTYPNPSNEGFNIIINDKALEGEMNMNIYTSTGSIILQKRIEVKEGVNVFMVNEKLLPGLYFIELKDQNNNTKMIRHLIN
jgi:hypothetical protein